MKTIIYLMSGLFLTLSMQAQINRSQPKPGPSPVLNIKKPQTFQLPNGLKVMVVEDHRLPKVSINLTLDNNPFLEGDRKGIDKLTSNLIGNGTSNISKDTFNEEIDFLGANINFSSSGAYANTLSKYYTRVLELLAQGALDPNFTQEEFEKEKAKLLENIKSDEKNVVAIANRVENVLAFGKNHPFGEYLSAETINNVTLADIKQNYTMYFAPQNAYLVIIGDVKFAETKALVEKNFSLWKNAKAPKISYSNPKNAQYTQINFVDVPNAVQSEISVINTVNLKMSDNDYFAALLANQILGGGGEGRLFLNLRETHGWTYGAYSRIKGSKFISKFKSSTSVRNAVTDSAVIEILKELKRIKIEAVTDEELKIAKAKYIGNFVMQMEKPQTIASYALNIETQKLYKDFYENYIKNINAVTPQQIMIAAKKYFITENARIVIAGKGNEILPNLEKLNIPIFYFDKFGNPTSKPEIKTIGTYLTAQSILENYIKAIGGEDLLKNVKTIYIKANGSLQGIPLEYTSKISSDNKMIFQIVGMGMTLMKQVINENGGYTEQQGQKMALEGNNLIEAKKEAYPFPELQLLNNKDIKISEIIDIDGKSTYVLKNGVKSLYFDVHSGLKVAESITQDEKTITTAFSDYRDIKGIQFPFKIKLNVGTEIEFTNTDIILNEGVTDIDFQ